MPKQPKAPRAPTRAKATYRRDPTISLFAFLSAIQTQNVEAYWTALDDLHSASAESGLLPQLNTNANDVTTPAEIRALITLCEKELGHKPEDRIESWPDLLIAKAKLIAALKSLKALGVT